MIKKFSLLVVSALVISGCGDSVTESLNGDTTVEDIKEKPSILIVTDIGEFSCVGIGIAVKNEYPNAETLIADNSVTCETYGKTEGDICKKQTLDEWKADGNSDVGISEGDSACVIGGDIS